MDLGPVEPVIAERQLSRADGGFVIVRIGKPRPYPEGGSAYCPYEIIGLDYSVVSRAGGIDDIQALLLALEKIGTTLAFYNNETGGTLFWIEEGNPDLGFPCITNLDRDKA